MDNNSNNNSNNTNLPPPPVIKGGFGVQPVHERPTPTPDNTDNNNGSQ